MSDLPTETEIEDPETEEEEAEQPEPEQPTHVVVSVHASSLPNRPPEIAHGTLPTDTPWDQDTVDRIEALEADKLRRSHEASAPLSSNEFLIGDAEQAGLIEQP